MQLPGLRSSSLEIARSHVILHCTTTSKNPSQVSPDFACQLQLSICDHSAKKRPDASGGQLGIDSGFPIPGMGRIKLLITECLLPPRHEHPRPPHLENAKEVPDLPGVAKLRGRSSGYP